MLTTMSLWRCLRLRTLFKIVSLRTNKAMTDLDGDSSKLYAVEIPAVVARSNVTLRIPDRQQNDPFCDLSPSTTNSSQLRV